MGRRGWHPSFACWHHQDARRGVFPASYAHGREVQKTAGSRYLRQPCRVRSRLAGSHGKRNGRVWMAHCSGMVGAGRDAEADSGGAGELYAVIGHGPRHLDLNITLVGRVLAGMEHLAALPRGTEALGFYQTAAERTAIVSARMLDELPVAQRPAVEVLRTETAAYDAWLEARRNRKDDWYLHGARHIDLCNALPPVRTR